MDKFKELLKHCKCSLSLHYNPHKDHYQSVEEYFKIQCMCNSEKLEDVIDDLFVYGQMKDVDTIFELTIYPDTPIGQYTLYHYDLDK